MSTDFSQKIPGYRLMEQIGETHYSIAYRARREGEEQTVVIKFLKIPDPTPEEIARFRHTYEIIRSSGIEGIIKILDLIDYEGTLVLVIEDFKGITLKDALRDNFTIERFLEYAGRLASILGMLHQNNISHNNIKPRNILLNPEKDIIKIKDSAVDAEIFRLYNRITSPELIKETLAYISPEQTGRMNCAVDYRTDLYSLGITFYELLTGEAPFRSDEPMEIIHSHIAIMPVPPVKRNPDIPAPVSDIVMKLLSKAASDRYQNSFGLAFDLNECLNQLRAAGRIAPFALGSRDISLRFSIPQNLVGRDKELHSLYSAFDRVSIGAVEVMLVTGEPGIGKSALVNEIHKPIIGKRGYFIAGKYDQFHRDVPYSSIIQAFQGLARQLLSENYVRISEWKELLTSALGNNGRIITDAIPEIELISGRQPDIPEMGPQETRNRFNTLFKNFVRVFADQKHPLVLFLDELQWADSASLDLIQTILTDHNLRFLLFIGSYRNTEVADHHPIMRAVDAVRTAGITVNTILLGNLNPDAVNQMITSFLRCGQDAARPLADTIYAKTKGSPFFVNQFLKTLYDRHHLMLDPVRGWVWDIQKAGEMQVTDNVVQFMADKLHELPDGHLEILRICACIGNRFDLDTLLLITGRSIDEVLFIIDDLIQDGLISRIGDLYRFHHDRIQEAAYSLLSQEDRERTHYQIGNFYLKRTPREQFVNRIFYIADQLNQAHGLISSRDEKIRLAGFNLKAGIKAKDSTAYAAAVNYLSAGAGLLPEDSWRTDYDLTYALHAEQNKCQYLNRNFDEAERLFRIILSRAASRLDKARAYNTMIILYTHARSPREAIELGLKALRLFGIRLSIDMGAGPVISELIKAIILLKKTGIDNVIHLPRMQDKELLVIHELMLNTGTPAYYVNQNLIAYLSLKGVNDSIIHGLTPQASIAFIVTAGIIQSTLGNYKLGYRIGEMAMKLNEKLDNRRINGAVQHSFAYFIQHWKKHIKYDLEIYNNVYQLSMNAGNFIFAGHSITAGAECRIKIGDPIDNILNDLKKHQEFITMLKNPLISAQYRTVVQWLLAMKGLTPERHDLSGNGFSIQEYIDRMRTEGNIFALCVALHSKIILLIWYGKYEEALQNAEEMDKHIKLLMGALLVADHYFNYSLILTALLRQEGRRDRRKLAAIRRNQRRLRKWAFLCPENFKHKYDLVAAELSGLDGRFREAVQLYHAAIAGAEQNSFILEEALSCELLAAFYLEWNCRDEAGIFIRQAHQCYTSLGASAKKLYLEERYPDLVRTKKKPWSADTGRVTVQGEPAMQALDLSTVTQVSQIISGEIMLDRLLKNIMHLSITNAGAQRGCLILDQRGYLILESEDKLVVNACEDMESGETRVMQSIPIEKFEGLSVAIVRYVFHSSEYLILGNAAQEGGFTNDPHIMRYGCKSILCMPLLNKGTLTGILYMENNLTANAFTPERLEILGIISAQTAISLQNAQLYESITSEITVRKQVEEAMRISEEKYRTILEDMQDAYCETDLHGNLTFVNPYVSTLTGFTRDELIGSNLGKKLARINGQKDFEQYLHESNSDLPNKPLIWNIKVKNGARIFLEIVASQIRNKSGEVTGFRGVGRDITIRRRLENDLLESYKKLQKARTVTILGLAKLAEYRDEVTGAHLERIREYARIIANELSTKPAYLNYITREYIEDIYNSAILHDIGKVGVPDAILLKPGKLTKEEFEVIKRHTTLGGDALRAVEAKIEGQSFLTLSKEIAYYHHERWDGSGYPRGLKGEEIPLSARIVAIADVYDALTSKRTYKEAFPHQQAVDIIIKDKGIHFAPDIVDAFTAHAEEFRRIREELLGTDK